MYKKMTCYNTVYMAEADLSNLLKNYQPSESAKTIVRKAKIVLLVGISGAGKNTLKRELLKDESYYDFISHTTRPPRINSGIPEKDGIDYYFIDTSEAIRMLEAGEYIEAKKVHSNVYGTTVKGLARSVESDKVAVNDVDVQGVDEYKSIASSVHAVFVLPPSYEEWERRRIARYEGKIDPDDNSTRLKSAMNELNFALAKGYFEFIINDDLQTAVDQVHAIVAGTGDTRDHMRGKELAKQFLDRLGTH
jgi:guanylate kinase